MLAKPAPISTPLTALMPIIAWAMSASSLSNTGSPQPTGTPEATTVMRAPHESPDLRKASMNASSCGTIASSAAKNGFASTLSHDLNGTVRSPICAR
jgi:hypothetical protein